MSLCIYYPIIKNEEFLIMLSINAHGCLRSSLRPVFKYKNGKENWSLKEITNNEPFKKVSEERLLSFRKFVSENGKGLFIYDNNKSLPHVKIDKSIKSIKLNNETKEQMEVELIKLVDAFFDLMIEYKKTIPDDLKA